MADIDKRRDSNHRGKETRQGESHLYRFTVWEAVSRLQWTQENTNTVKWFPWVEEAFTEVWEEGKEQGFAGKKHWRAENSQRKLWICTDGSLESLAEYWCAHIRRKYLKCGKNNKKGLSWTSSRTHMGLQP